MRYLILINQNPHAFDGMTDEQLRTFGRRHLELRDALLESGELVAGEGLANASLAHTVSVRGGRTVTSDGPFAELKEHLAGFYLIEVESASRRAERRGDPAGPAAVCRPALRRRDRRPARADAAHRRAAALAHPR